MIIKSNFYSFTWIKKKILASFLFVWKNKRWLLSIIFFIFIFYFFYIYFYIKPCIYISPNLFTDSGKDFIMACIDSSKLSLTFTPDEKKQLCDLIENIFYEMSKKGKPSWIGIEFYFYKFNFIIKLLWEVIELKKKRGQSVPNERLQMVASRIVEELLYYSRKHPTSKMARIIFYYYKKLLK